MPKFKVNRCGDMMRGHALDNRVGPFLGDNDKLFRATHGWYIRDMADTPELQPVQARLVIMGKMAAGKTFAQNHLTERYGAVAWTIAERIKQVSHALIGEFGDLGELLRVVLLEPEMQNLATYELLRFADSYEREPGKPRRLYQEVGEILRHLDESTRLCWEEDLARRIDAHPSSFTVVDIRSKESYGFLVGERGFRSLRIDASEAVRERRLLARDKHAMVDRSLFYHQSETDVDELEFDFVIDNEHDDPAEFVKALDALVAQLRAES